MRVNFNRINDSRGDIIDKNGFRKPKYRYDTRRNLLKQASIANIPFLKI